MESFFDLTQKELEDLLVRCKNEKYRAKQLLRWVYNKGIFDFDSMTDISKNLRSLFREMFFFDFMEPESIEKSKDGSTKFAFRTKDGHIVETVLMPEVKRTTLCVSTQIGCKMGCKFCVTGQVGFIRNLRTSEIISQIMTVRRLISVQITNVVLMGMGEPLDNLENVKKAIEIMGNPYGMNLSKRKITLSTVGLLDGLKHIPPQSCVIAISLNAADEEKRTYLMPINRVYPLTEILNFAKNLKLKKRERITFEYVLIKDINDSKEDAEKLADILSGIKCKINLIPYNESPYLPFKSPRENDVYAFQRILLKNRYTATVRKSKGQDVFAACGQLGSRYLM
ncbi:MAG: 23S rRNA (adenine(2503)-C(2))-methyltransferase RlmN [Desulfobacterota bacterium]|nr:23S rRNA (adenine(2503)-C(2))-methyltransferase RlmN [Thermodesulfobacteriota bacterium]MDW8001185.1 23S rRNA (adenine(2503)-C(2))-methyltransferase RlmN [Deltaproteobacteria bacterium]